MNHVERKATNYVNVVTYVTITFFIVTLNVLLLYWN